MRKKESARRRRRRKKKVKKYGHEQLSHTRTVVFYLWVLWLLLLVLVLLGLVLVVCLVAIPRTMLYLWFFDLRPPKVGGLLTQKESPTTMAVLVVSYLSEASCCMIPATTTGEKHKSTIDES